MPRFTRSVIAQGLSEAQAAALDRGVARGQRNGRLMPALTERVLDLALVQLAHGRAAGHRLRMSVNLSATDLRDLGLPARIGERLERHGCRGEELTVEVTETAIVGFVQHLGCVSSPRASRMR